MITSVHISICHLIYALIFCLQDNINIYDIYVQQFLIILNYVFFLSFYWWTSCGSQIVLKSKSPYYKSIQFFFNSPLPSLIFLWSIQEYVIVWRVIVKKFDVWCFYKENQLVVYAIQVLRKILSSDKQCRFIDNEDYKVLCTDILKAYQYALMYVVEKDGVYELVLISPLISMLLVSYSTRLFNTKWTVLIQRYNRYGICLLSVVMWWWEMLQFVFFPWMVCFSIP